MKGIIAGIKRSAIHDGDGLRTTVFFKGCPLKCIWCHNPEGIAFKPEIGFYKNKCIGCGSCVTDCKKGAIRMENGLPVTDRSLCDGCMDCIDYCPGDAREGYGKPWTLEALLDALLRDRAFYKHSGGGVTLSGGECLAQPEFVIALAKALYDQGISVDIDTCGCVRREILAQVAPYTDTFLYDIKAIDPAVHKRCTGRDNKLILENLTWLCREGHRVEIRYPYVPGWNDGECEAIGSFLKQLPGITKIKVLGYHNFADGKYDALDLPNTLPDVTVLAEDVDIPVAILQKHGLPAINGMRCD